MSPCLRICFQTNKHLLYFGRALFNFNPAKMINNEPLTRVAPVYIDRARYPYDPTSWPLMGVPKRALYMVSLVLGTISRPTSRKTIPSKVQPLYRVYRAWLPGLRRLIASS